MVREEAEETLKRFASEVCGSMLDAGLLLALFLSLSVLQGRNARGLWRASRDAERLVEHLGSDRVRKWWQRLQAKGWITRTLRVSREGQHRLQGLLPTVRWHEPWDGTWYVVSFDIAEARRGDRNQLRTVLKQLGFGQLHQSMWIAPRDAFGDIVSACPMATDVRAVIFGETRRLGRSDSATLASQVWKLDALNARYRNLVQRTRSQRMNTMVMMTHALSILRDDPQLPRVLLPKPWFGFAVERLVTRCSGGTFDLRSGQINVRP